MRTWTARLEDKNKIIEKLKADNAELRGALQNILNEIPPNPRFPIVQIIRDIAARALEVNRG